MVAPTRTGAARPRRDGGAARPPLRIAALRNAGLARRRLHPRRPRLHRGATEGASASSRATRTPIFAVSCAISRRCAAARALGLFLRATWAYRGQTRLIALAVLAFALAFSSASCACPRSANPALSLSASLAPAVDWMQAHDDALGYAGKALFAVGNRGACSPICGARRASPASCFAACRLLHIDVSRAPARARRDRRAAGAARRLAADRGRGRRAAGRGDGAPGGRGSAGESARRARPSFRRPARRNAPRAPSSTSWGAPWTPPSRRRRSAS